MNQSSVFTKIIQTTGDLPSLPPIANLVLEKLSDPEVTAKQLHDIISKDQALAARIIKIANSTFYGCSRSISRISDAVVIIGYKTLRSMLITTVMQDMLKNFGLLEKLLWEHSLGCAFGSRVIAVAVKFSKTEEAFLSGLLHDVGKVVLNQRIPEHMLVITKQVFNNGELRALDLERRELGFTHAQVGQLIGRKWNFAEEIEEAIGCHHEPQSAVILPPLSHIVNLANGFCHKLQIGPTRSPDLDLMRLDAVSFLGLNRADIDELLETTRSAFQSQKSDFSF
ncbi:HDOD domain-containing protein [Desulfoferrobacter suflitae]|uniref:HDOD domain-containing protein n=1 Tax=Desulfoferrobacter suflitae TaxID=2865782 RepID=UPI0021643971|nr:HDOD domain-containing protein [Desulfoferrobacter suflitae]MCK8602368.1 HDOD domain-containing protein [Desulfoferrobacter suflitae]